jgi:hypothetical protein
MTHHPGGVGAQQVVLEGGPVSSQDNQVGLDLLGCVQDLLKNRAMLNQSIDGNAA